MSCVAFAQEVDTHLVKQNETFSQIAQKYLGRPVYQAEGSLERLKKLNPQITDPDHIFPGQELVIKMATRDVASTPEAPVVQPVEAPRAPAPLIPATPSPQSEISLNIGTGYARIDSSINSSNAALLSRPSKTVGLKWEHHWTEMWQSHLRWSTTSISFENTAQGQALIDSNKTLTDAALGVSARLAPGLWSTLELGTSEEIFAPSYSAGTANLETRAIPTLRLLLSKDLVQVHSLKLVGTLGVGYLSGVSSSSYDVKPGREFVGQIQVVQKLKNFSIFTSGDYGQVFQDTSISTQKRTDLGLQLGISFPLGETTP